MQWGGNVGGPIIKNKLHFFANLERIDQNRGVTINIPARPELNFTRLHARQRLELDGPHRPPDQRATTPGRSAGCARPRRRRNQFPGVTNWTQSRAEKETDTDWTVVGTLNSVIANTRVNTLKLSYTNEDVFFGNPGYFDTGDQASLGAAARPPDPSRTASATRANRRMDPAYQLDETFAWFVPGKKGDHDLKFGASFVLHAAAHLRRQQPERHVHLLGERPRLQRRRTRAPIRTASRFACRARPTTSSTGRTSACSRRTNGR